MFKKFLVTLLFVFFFQLQASFVYAIQEVNYKGTKIYIDHGPKPLKQDTPSVSYTLTAEREGFFDSNQKYWAITWQNPPPTGEDSPGGLCINGAQGLVESQANGKILSFTWSIAGGGCVTKLGDWHLAVRAGDKGNFMFFVDQKFADSVFIKDYPFEIQQPGGGTLGLQAVNSNLGPSDTPQVLLLNGRANNKYEFWWQGSGEFALNIPNATYPPTDDNITLDIPKKGINFQNPGKKILCMEVGNDIIPGTENRIMPGIKCRYPVEFTFQGVQPPPLPPPPPGGGCTITIIATHTPNPAKDDSVSARVTGLPINEEFHADLIPSDPPKELTKQIADDKGLSKVFPVSAHIDLGNYTIIVYGADDKNNPFLCKKDFTVTPEGTPILTRKCGEKDENNREIICTKSGENSTCGNDKNPGIKTAFGCIHTNPAAFATDLLKFGIGIGGGLSFLMMLFGAFQMMTSSGNPETLNAGKSRITSAVIGLLFIIFAVLFLQIIGADILKLPGFER